jgi:hypothetical protein
VDAGAPADGIRTDKDMELNKEASVMFQARGNTRSILANIFYIAIV